MDVPIEGGVAKPPCEMQKVRGAVGDLQRRDRGPSREMTTGGGVGVSMKGGATRALPGDAPTRCTGRRLLEVLLYIYLKSHIVLYNFFV